MKTNPQSPPQTPAPVRVIIVDDHHVVRAGLRVLLEAQPRIRVVGEAANGRDAIGLSATARPDVALLDLRLPDLDGLEVCRHLKAHEPSPAVLFLTSYADDRTVLAAIEAGADGYLLKQATGQDIPSIILTVAGGGSVLDPLVTRQVLQAMQRPRPAFAEPQDAERVRLLTTQEGRVLELAAAGRSNKQIARELGLSEGTVRNYLSAVFSKLGVQSRVEAAAHWFHRRPVA